MLIVSFKSHIQPALPDCCSSELLPVSVVIEEGISSKFWLKDELPELWSDEVSLSTFSSSESAIK